MPSYKGTKPKALALELNKKLKEGRKERKISLKEH